jgi:hypothetical protein
VASRAGFVLVLPFGLENGGDMFLRNGGWLSTDYTVLYPRNMLNHGCENPISYIDPNVFQTNLL